MDYDAPFSPSQLSITTYYYHNLSLSGADNPGSRYPSLSHHTPRSHFIAERQAMRSIRGLIRS